MTASRGRWPKIDQDSGIEDAVLLILEWLGEQGVGAAIRVDAERLRDQEPAWTFTAGGGPLSHPAQANPRPHVPTTTIPRAGAVQFIESSPGCRPYGPVSPSPRG